MIITQSIICVSGWGGGESKNKREQNIPELEGVQELVGFLEVRTASVDFVDEIFNADDVGLAQNLGDDVVVGQRDTLLVDFAMAALVDKVGDGLEGGGTISDVGLDATEHSHGSVVDTEEDTVVELAKTQELEDLLGLGSHSHDTSDTDDKEDLSFGFDVEVTGVLGLTLHADSGTFGISGGKVEKKMLAIWHGC